MNAYTLQYNDIWACRDVERNLLNRRKCCNKGRLKRAIGAMKCIIESKFEHVGEDLRKLENLLSRKNYSPSSTLLDHIDQYYRAPLWLSFIDALEAIVDLLQLRRRRVVLIKGCRSWRNRANALWMHGTRVVHLRCHTGWSSHSGDTARAVLAKQFSPWHNGLLGRS
jgi:hypothetical protein